MRAMQSIEESAKKNTIKIENSNTENINWTLTLTLTGRLIVLSHRLHVLFWA